MIQTTALIRKERENPYPGISLPDNVREQTKQVSELSDLLEEYAKGLDDNRWVYGRMITHNPTKILTPKEINIILQTGKVFEYRQRYPKITGRFISQLIQSSYNAGYNEFYLNTENLKEISNICQYIEGTEEKPIKITIQGNTGDDCGRKTKYCEFNIQGSTEYYCGYLSENSIFNIEGDTGKELGRQAKDCTFNIERDVGGQCGYLSTDSVFNIKGNTKGNCGKKSGNCTFNIKGNTGDYCGQKSENSTFNIKKSVKHGCGCESKDSTFNIQGDIGSWCCQKAQNNTYITQKIESYRMVRRESSENNTIFLTNSSGQILDFMKK